MARIKIEQPSSKIIYSTSIEVRIDDMNYGNHLSNEVILKYFHETRVRFLKTRDSSELNLMGQSLIMGDVAVSYKRESFQGDVLKIDLYAEDFHKYGFDFIYQISRAGDEIARGKTGMIFFDYQNRKIALAPEQLQNFLLTT